MFCFLRYFSLVLSLSLVALLSFSQSQELVLQPNSIDGKDASINVHGINNNYGTDARLIAQHWTHAGIWKPLRSLIAFDFTRIPQGAVIESATLYLYGDAQSTYENSGATKYWLEAVTDNWDENMVTWSNQPSTTTANRVEVIGSTLNHDDYAIDVTAMVDDMTNNPNTGHGFMLKLQDESVCGYQRLTFASSDAVDPLKHPKLIIKYNNKSLAVGDDVLNKVTLGFQNPVTQKQNMQLHITNTKSELATLSISNLSGQHVFYSELGLLHVGDNQINLNLNDLGKGMYLMQLNLNQSQKRVNKRFIIN